MAVAHNGTCRNSHSLAPTTSTRQQSALIPTRERYLINNHHLYQSKSPFAAVSAECPPSEPSPHGTVFGNDGPEREPAEAGPPEIAALVHQEVADPRQPQPHFHPQRQRRQDRAAEHQPGQRGGADDAARGEPGGGAERGGAPEGHRPVPEGGGPGAGAGHRGRQAGGAAARDLRQQQEEPELCVLEGAELRQPEEHGLAADGEGQQTC